jgi:hypothetical protein
MLVIGFPFQKQRPVGGPDDVVKPLTWRIAGTGRS